MIPLLMDYRPTAENVTAWQAVNASIDKAVAALTVATKAHVASGKPSRTGPGAHGFSSSYEAVLSAAADYGHAIFQAEQFMIAHPSAS